ncbi:MAG: redoxin domain-containing protein, partial [Planctomycetes bacterium]|nr:redoxin domain-containing protein [Planctomycetota bacterium]
MVTRNSLANYLETPVMTRYLALASFVLFIGSVGFTDAAAKKEKEKDFRFDGKLTKDDPLDPQRRGPSAVHVVRMKAGKTYTIDMVSTDFDSYLRLQDGKGAQLAEDDDSGGMLNARIIFTATKDDDYKIVATTFGANMSGSYTLTVKTSGSVALPSTAHALMLGKPAPDFSADHAVNGKPAKLADLRDKVVLLCFWEVRSSTSAALLPKLNEWDKNFKAKGLAVVGITFYP